MPTDHLVRDALLAYAHYISIFAFASVMVAEFVLLRKPLQPELLSRIGIVDRWYGAITALVLVT